MSIGSAVRGGNGQAILAAYTVNELPGRDPRRAAVRALIDAHEHGSRILIVEPIARRMAGWWTELGKAPSPAAGGTADEWRFGTPLPERQRQFGRAAGLDPRELTARMLYGCDGCGSVRRCAKPVHAPTCAGP